MITLAGRPVGAGAPCMLIAELGTSHQGERARARELVDAAAEAGADCIKFQLVHADEILHPLSGIVDLPTGKVALYEQFRSLEKAVGFYEDLKTYTESRGVLFLCSPFGLRSARELKSIGAKALKVASPELNHFALLEEVAGYGLPLFLSTGVSTLGDIERALAVTGRTNIILMHCVTAYPAPETDYNLNVLSGLRAVFGVEVGVSDHSLDPVLVPVLAAASGACVVEKHFTLTRAGAGLDDPIALEPDQYRKMVRGVREAEQAGPAAARAELEKEHGADRVRAVMGTGVKELAASERANYSRTNRSVHAVKQIPRGARIGPADIAVLRTEKTLRPGIGPEFLHLVVGAVARRAIPPGEGVEWADII
ncbi:MAG: N-acetylneuraminate synthase family protein [Spirochaetia bacterium]